MFTNTMEQTKKMFDTMWGNWEEGVQKVYQSQQDFGKISVEAFKKQQDMFSSMTLNLKKTEEEMKNSLNKTTQFFKENSMKNQNEEVSKMLESWNEKMNEIMNQLQKLSATPTNVMVAMVEQSQERMYESMKNAVEEQNKLQLESKEVIEKFMLQIKESQLNFIKVLEEQTTQSQKQKKRA